MKQIIYLLSNDYLYYTDDYSEFYSDEQFLVSTEEIVSQSLVFETNVGLPMAQPENLNLGENENLIDDTYGVDEELADAEVVLITTAESAEFSDVVDKETDVTKDSSSSEFQEQGNILWNGSESEICIINTFFIH